SGAAIEEMNAVRKHLSMLKGGQLARRAAPARMVSLILSDVIGSPLDVIGSGPTAPDSSTYHDAVDVLKNYGVWSGAPASVRRHLLAGRRGAVPESPKARDAFFRRVHNVIVGDNRLAVEAASQKIRAMGYRPFILTTQLRGEAAEAANLFGALARRIRVSGKPFSPPGCLIAGGELTVTVSGHGKGGRCQEFVLAGAREIAGLGGCTIAAFGTDGVDGPTDAAGAMADEKTLREAWERGLELDRFIRQNDSYRFFRKMEKLIITGPTGTNVNDLYLLFIKK
ncbi:MAG TPA: MOFRL family protein, partial [Nitrospiria bacterium]|nr:MOFRL family protein [Nitrospiria bacterium]